MGKTRLTVKAAVSRLLNHPSVDFRLMLARDLLQSIGATAFRLQFADTPEGRRGRKAFEAMGSTPRDEQAEEGGE